MDSLKLLYLSCKHLLRSYFPMRTLRYSIVFFGCALFLIGLIIGVVFGIHPPPTWRGGFRSQQFVSNLSGLFFIVTIAILVIPTMLTMRGAISILNNTEIYRLTQLSPISPASKFWMTIGSMISISSFPYLIVLFPFFVMFLFLDPLISFATLTYFIVVSAWSVVLCLGTIVLLVHFIGKQKALILAFVFPFILLFVPSLFVYGAEDFRSKAPIIGYWQLILVSVSLILIPPLFSFVINAFYSLISINNAEPIRKSKEPSWGKYNPWQFILRQPVIFGLIPMLLLIILMIVDVIKFQGINESIFASTLFVFLGIPITTVMNEERLKPTRWQLAPSAFILKRAIWFKVNLPLFLICTCMAILMGHNQIEWIASLLSLLFLSMIVLSSHKLLRYSSLQNIASFLLIVGCFLIQLLWN
jgi:hypothetical protein